MNSKPTPALPPPTHTHTRIHSLHAITPLQGLSKNQLLSL